jgi:two-component system chemotaxis response regulator CheB
VRVVIVDDSATARAALRQAFEQEADLQVVGEAATRDEALSVVRRTRPDLVTMDVYMRTQNGLDVARELVSELPVPILVVTAYHPTDPQLAFRAIESGALDVCAKLPFTGATDYEKERRRMVRLVRTLASVPVVRRLRKRQTRAAAPALNIPADQAPSPLRTRTTAPALELVAIGASTGGPPLVARLLRELPPDYPLPVVVVQHITPGFGLGFSAWLASEAKKPVVHVEERTGIVPGVVYVAPDDRHLVMDDGELAVLDAPPLRHQRPSVDVLFESLARSLGARTLGVLLTGMGSDGAIGLKAMRGAGARTIAQAPESCVVAGMPTSAIELGAAELVCSPEDIVQELLALARPLAPERSDSARAGATTDEATSIRRR